MSAKFDVSDGDLAARLAGELASRPGGGGSDATGANTESAFAQWCADLLIDQGYVPDFQPASYRFEPPGRGVVMKIDGFHLDLDNGLATIFIARWNTSPADGKLPTRDVERIASQATAFLEKALDEKKPLYASLEPALPHALFASEIWKARDGLSRLNIVVLLNEMSHDSELPERMLGGLPVGVSVFDSRRLVRLLDGKNDERAEVILDFEHELGSGLPCLAAPITDTRYTAYIAIIDGETLARTYERYGPRLLEENVRAFLQLAGQVNKGIRKTLLEDPGSFFAYNNGLSATVNEIDVVADQSGARIRSLKGLQIVNGAQTMGSIHRAWRHDNASLSKVVIPVKITCVAPDFRQTIVGNISEFSNSQNAVKITDLKANSPFQIRVEELSRRIWTPSGANHWYFERTRGQYHDEVSRYLAPPAQKRFRTENPSSQKFVKTDVANLINGWEGRPHLISLGAQKSFVHFAVNWLAKPEAVWPDDGWYKDLISKAILHNAISAAVRAAGIKSYYVHVAAYIYSLIADRLGPQLKLSTIWANQSVSPQLQALAESWSKPVYEMLQSSSPKGDGDVREWSKKPACWTVVKKIVLPDPKHHIPEIEAGAGVVPIRIAAASVDLSGDREQQLRVVKEVTAGRVIRRDEAIKELQKRFGIVRLTNERRLEIESLLDDVTHLAFLDNEETTKRDAGLALIRAALKEGVVEHSKLVKRIAFDWLGASRVGSNIRDDIEKLFADAVAQWVLEIDGESVLCPTPSLEHYSDEFVSWALMTIVTRKKRIYSRRSVAENVLSSMGFTQQRESSLQRIDRCIDALVASGSLEAPSEGALRLGTPT